jgi:hypothetical protein
MTRREGIAELDLAGFTDGNGTLGRAVDSGWLYRPAEVTIKGKFLYWNSLAPPCKPERKIFDRFVRLWELPDSEIARFARTYGHLSQMTGRVPLRTKGREKLSQWRALSKECWTFLTIAGKLGSDRYTKADEREAELAAETEVKLSRRWLNQGWTQRWLNFRDDLVKAEGSLKRTGSMFLFWMIERWLSQYGSPGIGLKASYKRPRGPAVWQTVIDFDGSLLRYIGLELMLVAARNDIFMCSACHRPYVRDRAQKGFKKDPKPGERNYCGAKACIRERNRIAAGRFRKKATVRKNRDGKKGQTK